MGAFQDLTGQQSGTLIAKKYLGNSKWLCECIKCKNEVIIKTNCFNNNLKLHRDGCKHVKNIHIGDRFGYLTVESPADDYIKPKSGQHESQWKCICICGRLKNVLESNLKSGKSTSCGLCSNRISIPEKMIFYYLSQIFEDIQENYRPSFLNGLEIDIYISSLHLGIEYDGERWHKNIQKDINKTNLCLLNNVHLIRVREPKCERSNEFEYQIITPKPTTNGSHMTIPIKQIINILKNDFHVNCSVNIDCLRDNATICSTILSSKGGNSLLIKKADIAKEWDYNKNYPLTPNDVSVRSGRKAWWICPNGHSYNSVIASRTGSDACGCPMCSNKGSSLYQNGLYIGEHSLLKERPDIAAEFMEDKNGISANDISVSSNKKMWFKCSKCDYEWQSKINNRTSSNTQGCPMCAKEKVRLSKCKQVLCLETGILYESATSAGKKLNINSSRISACCRGEQQTSGGYHWQYLN